LIETSLLERNTTPLKDISTAVGGTNVKEEQKIESKDGGTYSSRYRTVHVCLIYPEIASGFTTGHRLTDRFRNRKGLPEIQANSGFTRSLLANLKSHCYIYAID
jgi:hypothetical protein